MFLKKGKLAKISEKELVPKFKKKGKVFCVFDGRVDRMVGGHGWMEIKSFDGSLRQDG